MTATPSVHMTDQSAKALVGALRHQQFRRWPDLHRGCIRLDDERRVRPGDQRTRFRRPAPFRASEAMYNVMTTFPIQDIAVNIYPRLETARCDSVRWNPDRYSPTTSIGT